MAPPPDYRGEGLRRVSATVSGGTGRRAGRRGVVAGRGGGRGAVEGRTLASLLESVQPLSVVVPSRLKRAPPFCRGRGLGRVSTTACGEGRGRERSGGGRRRTRRGARRGGGPHVISVVAREGAVAQRGGALVVVEGTAILSRERIGPRQHNSSGRGGAESGAVGVVAGRGGVCGAAGGRTSSAWLLERVQLLSLSAPLSFLMAPPSVCERGSNRSVGAGHVGRGLSGRSSPTCRWSGPGCTGSRRRPRSSAA